MVLVLQCYSATVLQCYSATVLQCYSATVLQCYSATVLQCYSATVLQCYSATVLLSVLHTLLRSLHADLLPLPRHRVLELVHPDWRGPQSQGAWLVETNLSSEGCSQPLNNRRRKKLIKLRLWLNLPSPVPSPWVIKKPTTCLLCMH